jgi:hypothetical protein
MLKKIISKVVALMLVSLLSVNAFAKAKHPNIIKLPKHENPYRTYIDSCVKISCLNIYKTLIAKAQPGEEILVVLQELDFDITKYLVLASNKGVKVGVIINTSILDLNADQVHMLLVSGANIYYSGAMTHDNFVVIRNFEVISGTIKDDNIVLYHNETIADVYINDFNKYIKYASKLKL